MVRSEGARRLFLSVAVLAGWVALALQFHVAIDQAHMNGRTALDGVLIGIGYFTILTNILAALALTLALFGSARTPSPAMIAAIAVYMGVIGLVYVTTLRRLWAPEGAQLVADAILHYAMPVLVLAYWLVFVPKGTLRWSEAVIWLVYPAAYLAAALTRGVMTGFYPYPFLDLDALGAMAVAVNGMALFALFLGFGLALVLFDRLAAQPRPADGLTPVPPQS